MIATAHISMDRAYFELHYDESLRHRSKLKKYEVWFAVALIVFGLVLAVLYAEQWLVGALFASAGVYEFAKAATDKRRWVRARVATVSDGKTVELEFDGDTLTSASPLGTATMRLEAFAEFVPASHGFFLVPDTGVSLYVPRASIHPADGYPALLESLSRTVARSSDRSGA